MMFVVFFDLHKKKEHTKKEIYAIMCFLFRTLCIHDFYVCVCVFNRLGGRGGLPVGDHEPYFYGFALSGRLGTSPGGHHNLVSGNVRGEFIISF
jgi:hypothetical protein